MMEVYICLMFIMFATSSQSLCTNDKKQPLQKVHQKMCIQNVQVDCSKDVNVQWLKPVNSLYVKEYTVRIKDTETGNLLAEKGLPNTSSSWSHTLTENLTRIRVEVWSLNSWGHNAKLNTVVSKDCTLPYVVTSRIQTSTSRSPDSSTSMDILTYVTMTSSTHNYIYGNHMTLSCTSDCLSPCTYTWYKNNTHLHWNNKSENKIDTLSFGDTGTYVCSVRKGNFSKSSIALNITVTGIANVQLKMSTDNITEGKTRNLSISCQAECNPPCKYTLLKDGNILTNRFIDQISRRDSGKYQCLAENSVTSDRSLVELLDVKYGPAHANASLPRYLIRGDKGISLKCSADCSPACSYTWFKGRKGVSNTQYMYFTPKVKTMDEGNYTCQAKNEIGEAFISKYIEVFVKPSKVRITKSKTYPAENEQFSIECNTKRQCVPTCKFFWINVTSGQNVSFNRKLTFNPVQRTHAGSYTCTAYNELGQKSKATSFQIYYANVLMDISPSKQNVRVGDPFPTIQCRMECFRSCFNLVYYKKDSSGRKTRIYMRPRSVKANDKGTYYCKATYYNHTRQRYIDIFSTSFSITVTYDMLYINSRGRTLKITEGMALSNLSCILLCHPSCTELSLYKNGRIERHMQTFSIFGISPLLRNSSGHYKCKAKTAAGKILTSEEVFVDIQYKPVIYPSFANKIVLKERQSFNISFTLKSNPAAVIRILKNRGITRHRPIQTGNDSLYSLRLRNVTCWDKGYYEVEAVNSIGHDSTPFNLTVMCAPRLQDGNVKSNMSVTLPIFSKTARQWEIYSHPESNVVLTFQNDEERSKKIDESFGVFHQLTPTSNGSVFRFSILNVTEEHFGVYTILLQNSVGSLHLSLAITPTGPPLPPTNLSADCSKPTQYLLSWRPQFPGGSPQIFKIHMWSNNTWVKIKENITDDRNEKGLVDVVLDDLTENEHYKLSISAVNRESKEVFALDTVNCTTLGTIRVQNTSSSIDMTGSAVGAGVSFVLIALIIVILFIRRKRRDNTKSTTHSFQDENVVGSLDIIGSSRNEYVYSHITPTRLKETPLEGALYAEVDKSRKGGYGPIKSDVCPSAISQTYDVPKSSRWKNQDGLVYMEVEFTKSQTDSDTIIGDDTRTTYTEVEFVKP